MIESLSRATSPQCHAGDFRGREKTHGRSEGPRAATDPHLRLSEGVVSGEVFFEEAQSKAEGKELTSVVMTGEDKVQ